MPPEIVRIPSPIDVHVHLREPGATQKEDFTTGTRAAVAGGYSTVLDMPNNPVIFDAQNNPIDYSTTTPQRLNEKIKLAQNRIFCDVGFHFGGNIQSSQYFEEVRDQVFGLKVYMNHTTGPLFVEDPAELQTVFSNWPRGKVVMVHAEGDTLRTAIDLARENGQRLHVCHVSQKREIKMIKKAKEERLRITCEVSAHHLFLSDKDLPHLESYGAMKPPLATELDRKALWENLDVVDVIASDHAPHAIAEKEAKNPPFGVPGLETTLPLMLNAVADGKLTLKRLADLISHAPRRIFGIKPTHDTFTEVDLKKRYTIDSSQLQTKAGWTPFDGLRVTGKIMKTVLHGDVVFDGEEVKEIPKGRVIYPYP